MIKDYETIDEEAHYKFNLEAAEYEAEQRKQIEELKRLGA